MERDQHALWGTEMRRSASEKPIHSRGISWSKKEYSGNHRGNSDSQSVEGRTH